MSSAETPRPEVFADERPASPWLALAADAAQRLHEQAVRGLVAGLDHLLRQQSWASERLRMHAGAVVRVGLRASLPGALPVPEVLLAITPAGFFEPAPLAAAPRATLLLEPSIDVFFALTRDGVEGLPRHLRVEGDVMLAATLGELARHLRWDAEEDLSRVVGDVAARRAFNFFQTGLDRVRGLAARPVDSLARAAASGQGPLVSRDQLRALSDVFTGLDEQIKRLERRAAQLGGLGASA